jgi:hypothetical protein
VPFGTCSIVIPANIIITFTGETFAINIQTLTIAGTFSIVSSASSGFTFNSVINIIVQNGATFRDQTSGHQFYFRTGSLCTFYPGASFIGTNTQVFTYTSLPATGSLGASYTFGSSISGPFTFGILLDGSIQTFAKVTFIAAVSGSFTATTTWLGGLVPTADLCVLAGGCGLSISSGCTLSTASLNDELNINFNLITIAAGGICQLGTAGVNTGFRFRFLLALNCYGQLIDVSGGNGGIYFPFGSGFNLYIGGSFTAQVSTFLYAYNTVTGQTSGTPVSLSISLNTSFFVTISLSGAISVSTNGKIFLPFIDHIFLLILS